MACTFYEWKSGTLFGDYWCIKKNDRVDSSTYDSYCKGYNYKSCPIFKKNESSGCFITTVTCGLLGKDDNDIVLNNLRGFRNNILQVNPEYYEVLKEYDSIGPVIAFKLLSDNDSLIIANSLYNLLFDISSLIMEKRYDEAVEKYRLMTLMLINYYGIKHKYNDIVDRDYGYDNFNPSLAGHGYILRKKYDIKK